MGNNRRLKVLYMTNVPAPYRVDFFNKLGESVDLTVTYEGRKASDRDENWESYDFVNYKAVFLKGIRISADKFFCLDIIKILRESWDVIVVGGYATPTSILAIKYMQAKRIPYCIEADGGLIPERENALKRWIKSSLIKKATMWFSSGKNTTKYLVYYGAKEDYCFSYPFSSLSQFDIDNDKEKALKRINDNAFYNNNQLNILSIGQFIYRKGYDVLFKALENIGISYHLTIVGGTLTQEMKDSLSEEVRVNSTFVPFKKKNELERFFLDSDIFVLPTREDIWGLVINEAMSHGLPIITTNKCVAGLELVDDNGYIIPVEDFKMLQSCIVKLNNAELLKEFSKKSLENIKEYSYENMVQAHLKGFALLTKGD